MATMGRQKARRHHSTSKGYGAGSTQCPGPMGGRILAGTGAEVWLVDLVCPQLTEFVQESGHLHIAELNLLDEFAIGPVPLDIGTGGNRLGAWPRWRRHLRSKLANGIRLCGWEGRRETDFGTGPHTPHGQSTVCGIKWRHGVMAFPSPTVGPFSARTLQG